MSRYSWALIAILAMAAGGGYFAWRNLDSLPFGNNSGAATETPTGVILNNMATSATGSPQKNQEVIVNMTAKNFAFEPKTIRISQGDLVELRITSTGAHDFSIDALGIHQALPPGTTIIRFAPEAKGTYDFYCSVPGHKERGMKGQLIVH